MASVRCATQCFQLHLRAVVLSGTRTPSLARNVPKKQKYQKTGRARCVSIHSHHHTYTEAQKWRLSSLTFVNVYILFSCKIIDSTFWSHSYVFVSVSFAHSETDREQECLMKSSSSSSCWSFWGYSLLLVFCFRLSTGCPVPTRKRTRPRWWCVTWETPWREEPRSVITWLLWDHRNQSSCCMLNVLGLRAAAFWLLMQSEGWNEIKQKEAKDPQEKCLEGIEKFLKLTRSYSCCCQIY